MILVLAVVATGRRLRTIWVLLGLAALLLPVSARVTRAVAVGGPALSFEPAANFYHMEEWQPGKTRRWMRNGGELRIRHQGPPVRVNVRFPAESFRISRTLQVRSDQGLVLEATIPSGSLYVVIKDLAIPREEIVLVLSSPQGTDEVDRYLKNGDKRHVSIAFGPFSAIDARTPDAQREQTGAFPQAERIQASLSPRENVASNLRREGRLSEAREEYRAILAADRIHSSSYLWSGLTLVLLDDLDAARAVLDRGRRLSGVGLTAMGIRRAASRLRVYLDQSELLASRETDPGRGYRQRGEIYRAADLYRTMLRRRPGDVVASYWLGLLTVLAERVREAAPLLETVAAANPESPDAALIRDLQPFLRALAGR